MPSEFPGALCSDCLLTPTVAMPRLGGALPGGGAVSTKATPEPGEIQPCFPGLEIFGLLGAGGMGAVYLARQPRLDRLVALKILKCPPERREEFALRFEREAQVMARLSHPGVVAIHDFGEVERSDAGERSLFYFVMEYVEGSDLNGLIRSGELSVAQALALIPKICEALQYAHDQGITHRDIKPANILVSRSGEVKIADFGLAKLLHGDETLAMGLTLTGTAMGTPHYMAPEQWEPPEKVDHRADIYALGVVIYELLTGERPAGVFEPPSKKCKVDRRIDTVVMRAMEKDPAKRFSHAREVGEAITRVAAIPQAGLRRRRPLAWSAAAAGLALCAGLGVAMLHEGFPGRGAGRGAERIPEAVFGMVLGTVPEAGGGDGALAPATVPEPTAATRDAPFENSLGMKFVPAPGTEVLFCIHETRWRDYEEYAKRAKERVEESWKIQSNDSFVIQQVGADHPVTRVSWDDAQAFCKWLSEKEGRTYRLPTDREWSLAVGIGREEDWKFDTTPATVFKVPDAFPWGDEWPPSAGAGNYSDESRRAKAPRDDAKYLDGYDDDFPTTAPVKSFEANQLGLFDLGGNVWEWCEDWYSDEQKERVLRGGSWNNRERGNLLSSYRGRYTPDIRVNGHGFRVVLEIAAESSPPTAASHPAANSPVSPPSAKRMAVADNPIHATKDAPFENSLGMKFVPVPGTDVLFCIHEVRYRDYEEYAKQAKESVEGSWKTQTNDGFEIQRGGDDHPVTRVSWDDAQAFCKWLSEKEGRTYRLPKDREWSIAVGIGEQEEWKSDTTPATVFKVPDEFPWGDEWPPPQGAGNYSDESRRAIAPRDDTAYFDGYDDGHPTTAPVMSFESNKLGLFDLGGNVFEWCEDWYSDEQNERVLRGGSWNYYGPGILLSSVRYRWAPETRRVYHGFRVVLEIAAESSPPTAASHPAANSPVSPPAAKSMAVADNPIHATKDAPFENSLGMKFVPVPGTDVLFCIHETRWRDYEEYAKNAKESVEESWKNQSNNGFEIKRGGEDHPVTRVNWDDAQGFCKWLSEKEGKTYRLPTDREWSNAVGIGEQEDWKSDTTPATVFKPQGAFPWGDEWPPPAGAGNYSDESRKAKAPRDDAQYLDGYDDGFPTTAPVMSFEANQLGLFDLGGNVWEWVEDWYSDEKKDRVLRGTSWFGYGREGLLSSRRYNVSPSSHGPDVCFRVVLEITAESHPPNAASPPTANSPVSPPAAKRMAVTDNAIHATRDAPFENTLGMELMPVPGHEGVWLARTSTRVRDFEAFVIDTGYDAFEGASTFEEGGWNQGGGSWRDPRYPASAEQGPDHPVVCVSWEDAKAFCEWLSRREDDVVYRLPTDAEWSAAAGNQGRYPWGDSWPPPAGAGNFASRETKIGAFLTNGLPVIVGYSDGFARTSPVGSFRENELGFFDMSGNVWEWCEDEYKASMNDADALEKAPHLNTENLEDGTPLRVMRGGSWFSAAEFHLRPPTAATGLRRGGATATVSASSGRFLFREGGQPRLPCIVRIPPFRDRLPFQNST